MAAALAVCRELGVPITSRGPGTSVAGNAVGPGMVLDFSRHLNQVLEVDPAARTAVVEPGTVQAVLQKAAAPHGLRFGPDPSTHTRCTIGGMIGNNACGSRSLAYGRTSDNVAGLDAAHGCRRAAHRRLRRRRSSLTRGAEKSSPASLRDMVGRIWDRRAPSSAGSAGRSPATPLEHLLPERFDVTGVLVGSEGTLAVITEATVRLVADPPHRVLVVLGYADIRPRRGCRPRRPRVQADRVRGHRLPASATSSRAAAGPDAVPPLPRGQAWLLVEIAGDDLGEGRARPARLADRRARSTRWWSGPGEAAPLWRIREDGAGLAGRAPSDRPAYAGWEDAAVPPARLGAYLAGLRRACGRSTG